MSSARNYDHERGFARAREIDRDVPLSADWRTVYRAMAATFDDDDDGELKERDRR